MNIGQRIRKIRKAGGWQAQALATQAGLSLATWYRAEQGADLRISTLLAMLNAMNRRIVIELQREEQPG